MTAHHGDTECTEAFTEKSTESKGSRPAAPFLSFFSVLLSVSCSVISVSPW